MTQRKIIHIDCDCFYAAIEMRDDPRLAGKPLAVGGSADRRGVIATCNYEARAYGVRSAMASGHALKLCPDLTIVKPRMDAYKEASREIHNIFREYTELIEPLSLDEAYLDVSDSPKFSGSATRIAEDPLDDAMNMANSLANLSPNALREAKNLINFTARNDRSAILQRESDVQDELIGGPDQREAVKAYLEKRAPQF